MVYRVTQFDLVDDLKGVPIEIAQKMVERQYEQTGKYNISIFQSNLIADAAGGGFDWIKSEEGDIFWHKVIGCKDFDVFFKRYNKCYYIKRTSETKIKDIIAKLVSLGGKTTRDHRESAIYYISPKTHEIRQCDSDSIVYDFLETFYTETFVDTVYEYTMDEIAEKLGIDVKQLKIKK